ncbi:MAG TPA: hypothetical protein VJM31_17900 [Vicinamibacterales bacterium]|nr:hypothetical protein [Vicinamibacterales bacterium]
MNWLRLRKNAVNPIVLMMVAYTSALSAPEYFGVTHKSFAVFFTIAWVLPLLRMTIADDTCPPKQPCRIEGARPSAVTYVFMGLGVLPWLALPSLHSYDHQSLLWQSLPLPEWSRWAGAALITSFVLWPLAQRIAARHFGALAPRLANLAGSRLALTGFTGLALSLVSANLFIALLAFAGLVLRYFAMLEGGAGLKTDCVG